MKHKFMHEWAKYFTIDFDGDGYEWQEKPKYSQKHRFWMPKDKGISDFSKVGNYEMGEMQSKDTLQKR